MQTLNIVVYIVEQFIIFSHFLSQKVYIQLLYFVNIAEVFSIGVPMQKIVNLEILRKKLLSMLRVEKESRERKSFVSLSGMTMLR